MRKISKRILSFILTLVMILTMGLSGVVLESAKAADSGTTVNGSLGFELMSGGTDNKIIVKTDLPKNTPAKDFTANDNGCDIDQTSNTVQWVGWIGMKSENDAIVFTFNFNKKFTEGQQYKLPRKALFGFLDNKKYYLDADYTFTWNGTSWSMTKEKNPSFNMTQIRYGTNKLIQVNTDLPVEAMSDDFTAGTDGFDLKQEVNEYQQLGYASMANADGTVVLTFNFNKAFVNGENYKLPKGAKFKFNNGAYELDRDYTFWFDGSDWFVVTETDTEKKVTVDGKTMDVSKIVDMNQNVEIGFHTKTLVQFSGIADLGAPENDTLFSFRGKVFVNGVEVKDVKATGYKGLDKITIGNLPDHYNKVVTIMAGSVISYGDKAIIINKAFHAQYKDSEKKWVSGKWSGNHPVIAGDTNENGLVDSTDLVHLKRAEGSTVTDFTDIVADDKIDTYDLKSMRRILVGDTTWNETKEILLAEENFNGGGEFVTFADCPPDPTDTDKMQEYKDLRFNTSLIAVNDDNTNKEYVTMDVEDTGYQLDPGEEELKFTALHSGSSTLLQLTTNLPRGIKVNDFLAEDTTHVINKDWSRRPGYFSVLDDEKTSKVYLNMNFPNDKLVEGDHVILKAGTKLKVADTYYVLTKNYTFKYLSYYHDAIDTLKSLDLHAWLRNDSNETDLMTADRLNKIAPYAEDVDGVYFTDEPFWTATMQDKSNTLYDTKENLMDFSHIKTFAEGNFNTYFSGKYFHVNHSGVTSFNKYCEVPIKEFNMPAYYNYLKDYTTNAIVGANTDTTKNNIGFDHYPFGYKTFSYQQVGGPFGKSYLAENLDEFQTTGISPYYLINLLISAKVAKENNNSMSVAIQTYLNTSNDKKKRAIDNKKEITMQLYATMACGVDVYEYYLYNTVESQNQYGMIDATGNKTDLYTKTQDANKEALPFADVLKTFTWQGAEFVTGTTSNNSKALSLVTSNSSLNLMLGEDSDGVLTNAATAKPTDDILVGYYTKGGQDAYMIANYNDPRHVTNKNNVTLKFDGCNYARVYTGDVEKGLTSKIVPLDADGSYKFTLQPGGGCFVIPVNAAS